MRFSKIEAADGDGNENSKDITDTELQEVLELLNNKSFKIREEFPEPSYNEPEDLTNGDHCHATARKYADSNKNLAQVSGYLISYPHPNEAKLKAHSIVQDTNTNRLFELLPVVWCIH